MFRKCRSFANQKRRSKCSQDTCSCLARTFVDVEGRDERGVGGFPTNGRIDNLRGRSGKMEGCQLSLDARECRSIGDSKYQFHATKQFYHFHCEVVIPRPRTIWPVQDGAQRWQSFEARKDGWVLSDCSGLLCMFNTFMRSEAKSAIVLITPCRGSCAFEVGLGQFWVVFREGALQGLLVAICNWSETVAQPCTWTNISASIFQQSRTVFYFHQQWNFPGFQLICFGFGRFSRCDVWPWNHKQFPTTCFVFNRFAIHIQEDFFSLQVWCFLRQSHLRSVIQQPSRSFSMTVVDWEPF